MLSSTDIEGTLFKMTQNCWQVTVTGLNVRNICFPFPNPSFLLCAAFEASILCQHPFSDFSIPKISFPKDEHCSS